MRSPGGGSGELAALNTELESLRATLAGLTTERTRVGEDAARLRNSLSSAQTELASQTQSSATERQKVSLR
jgi:predicted  nucleic acid-binding Zn-ribbon protein